MEYMTSRAHLSLKYILFSLLLVLGIFSSEGFSKSTVFTAFVKMLKKHDSISNIKWSVFIDTITTAREREIGQGIGRGSPTSQG